MKFTLPTNKTSKKRKQLTAPSKEGLALKLKSIFYMLKYIVTIKTAPPPRFTSLQGIGTTLFQVIQKQQMAGI